MTHSALTNQIRLSNQSDSRGGTVIDTFLIHHQAGTNDDGTINAMVSGSREVSANYTISSEGRITCVVDEDRRAWTSGSSEDGGRGRAWDMRAITVEIENESGSPDWRISDAALDAAAALLNDLRSRYNITHVLGHRDLWTGYKASYATYCPGPNTVAEIVSRANGGASAPAAPAPPSAAPATSGSWSYWEPTGPLMARVQRALSARGRYNHPDGTARPADGVAGTYTRKGIQITLNVSDMFNGDIDGDIQRGGCYGMQSYAAEFGGYLLRGGIIDGAPRELTWECFALGLER